MAAASGFVTGCRRRFWIRSWRRCSTALRMRFKAWRLGLAVAHHNMDITWDAPATVTTRILTFWVGDPPKNLHFPFLLGGEVFSWHDWSTTSVYIFFWRKGFCGKLSAKKGRFTSDRRTSYETLGGFCFPPSTWKNISKVMVEKPQFPCANIWA